MVRARYRLLLSCYLFLVTVFTLFTYTQVDLNLTLSSNAVYQSLQHQLTQIGYFNRPFSTAIFFSILGAQTLFYFWLLFRTDPDLPTGDQLVRPNLAVAPPRGIDADHASGKRTAGAYLSSRQLWTVILVSSLILMFSYPAFAHDVFNYMFDARTIVKYGQNPYFTTPLDFPGDDWTRFMRWTHVGSVYPPGWLVVSIPFYLLGFGKFTLTLLSFKVLGLLSFFASSWLMKELAGKRAWILWSFNPLVLIESLSSVHNDAVMTTFALLAFYIANSKKGYSLKEYPLRIVPERIIPYISLIFGASIKYTSILLIPFLRKPVYAAIAAWVGTIVFFFVREINPWYTLLPITISFMSKNNYLNSIALISSFMVMYRYYPCVAIFSC